MNLITKLPFPLTEINGAPVRYALRYDDIKVVTGHGCLVVQEEELDQGWIVEIEISRSASLPGCDAEFQQIELPQRIVEAIRKSHQDAPYEFECFDPLIPSHKLADLFLDDENTDHSHLQK